MFGAMLLLLLYRWSFLMLPASEEEGLISRDPPPYRAHSSPLLLPNICLPPPPFHCHHNLVAPPARPAPVVSCCCCHRLVLFCVCVLCFVRGTNTLHRVKVKNKYVHTLPRTRKTLNNHHDGPSFDPLPTSEADPPASVAASHNILWMRLVSRLGPLCPKGQYQQLSDRADFVTGVTGAPRMTHDTVVRQPR